MSDSGPPPVRCRERTIELLRRHFAEGHLSAEELETRMGRVQRATSVAELEDILASLGERGEEQPSGKRRGRPSREIRLQGSAPERWMGREEPRDASNWGGWG